jgi:hypothetical protein
VRDLHGLDDGAHVARVSNAALERCYAAPVESGEVGGRRRQRVLGGGARGQIGQQFKGGEQFVVHAVTVARLDTARRL